jgi:FkbH-like protein
VKFTEALQLSRTCRQSDKPVIIASGMETTLFQVYLKAHAAQRGAPFRSQGTEFGDLRLSLLKIAENEQDAVSVILINEWDDICPGIGYRSPHAAPLQPGARVADLVDLIDRVCLNASASSVIVVPPAMHYLDFGISRRGGFDDAFMASAEYIVQLRQVLERHPRCHCLQTETVLSAIPRQQWSDVVQHFRSGWPYSCDATDILAAAALDSIHGRFEPKKVLITDLDNTLWAGIVGEAGVDDISWEPQEATFRHLVYQKHLARYAAAGTVVCACSKNEPDIAARALKRADMHMAFDRFALVKAGWEPKSVMIHEILRRTHQLPSSAVFVDDSAFELQEVAGALPEITCLRFPEENRELPGFLARLNNLIATTPATAEDAIRGQTLQTAMRVDEQLADGRDIDAYLASLDMRLTVEPAAETGSDRAFQLVNKTNQFNLNGIRETPETWRAHFAAGHLILQIALTDHLADYGIIAVIILHDSPGVLSVLQWVMSCRVFSRRVEFGLLGMLRERAGGRPLKFLYVKTAKNAPLTQFLTVHGAETDGQWTLLCQPPVSVFGGTVATNANGASR